MTAKLWGLVGGLLVLLAILGGLYAWGRSDGRAAQAKDDAALVERKNAALRNAADALAAAARKFREIDTTTRLAEEGAEQWRLAAGEADRQAAQTKTMFEQRIRELAAEAEREKFNCSEARMRICGVPLR